MKKSSTLILLVLTLLIGCRPDDIPETTEPGPWIPTCIQQVGQNCVATTNQGDVAFFSDLGPVGPKSGGWMFGTVADCSEQVIDFDGKIYISTPATLRYGFILNEVPHSLDTAPRCDENNEPVPGTEGADA